MMSAVVRDLLTVCRRVRQRGLACGAGGGDGGGGAVKPEDGASAL